MSTQDKVNPANAPEIGMDEYTISCLRVILGSKEGKHVVCHLLDYCGTFSSIFDPSSKIYRNAGKQDVGHFLMAQLVRADKNALIEMMASAYSTPSTAGKGDTNVRP